MIAARATTSIRGARWALAAAMVLVTAGLAIEARRSRSNWLLPVLAQRTKQERAEWNRPVDPFRIIGNVYYVGAQRVSAFLIITDAGAILIDGGLPETAPHIARNVASLGFELATVKYLLNSHAHYDHAGGLAALKRLSGATMVASAEDAKILRTGSADLPPVAVERIVDDGDRVTVGGTTLTARLTPGHTKGCTTWTMATEENGRRYEVIFYCSTSVVDRLVDNVDYPNIVADYTRTFATLRSMRADVFLAPHPDFFHMESKRRRLRTAGAHPFADSGELGRFVDASERQFKLELRKQQSTQ